MIATSIMITLVVCLAGFVQGLTGFGFGLVAMPLLPLMMDLKEAVALTVPLNLVVCATTFWSIRGGFSWRQGVGLILGVGVGVPLGVLALSHLSEALLLRGLGVVLLGFALNELILARTGPVPISPRLASLFGVVSGGLSGAFNMGGPPAIAFAYSQPWAKEQVASLLQIVFGVSAILRLVMLGSAGYITKPLLTLGLWSVIPMVVAISLGNRLFARIPHLALKRVTFLFLGAMGINYLFFSRTSL